MSLVKSPPRNRAAGLAISLLDRPLESADGVRLAGNAVTEPHHRSQ